MCVPRRIQRKRTRDWRMPANTVYVGRPSRWGNPYIVGKHAATAEACVALFIERYEHNADYRARVRGSSLARTWLAGVRLVYHAMQMCCWCGPTRPCKRCRPSTYRMP